MLLGARQFFERRGAPPPPLPYDAEVEYIENTIGAWIDTGFVQLSKVLECVMSISVPEAAKLVTDYDPLFGNDQNDNTAKFVLAKQQRTPLLFWRVGSTSNLGVVTAQTSSFFEASLKTDSENGYTRTIGTSTASGTYSGSVVGAANPMAIFAVRQDNSVSLPNTAGYRIASLRISQDNLLVRDFIPVRFTNELGQSEGAMYDRVSGRLFRNAGTGAFTVGPDKTSWTNPYITDGLVAMWDGEWNAGGGVHDPNATDWKDLIGNYDFTLSQAATVNTNHIYCNGSQSAGDTGALIDVPVTTLEIVSQYLNSTANTAIFMTGGGSSYYREVFGIVFTNTWFVFANQTVSLKDIILHSWSKNLDNVDCYRDGINIGVNGNSTLDMNSNRGYIGRIGGTGNVGCECRIYSIRLYSRALSASEVAANYAIDRARFNLP